MLFALAKRNNIDLPFKSIEGIKDAYNFSNLQDFLDIYYQGMGVLQTDQDFYDLTDAYLRRASADNVKHAEIFFDPQGHTARGVPFATAIEGILGALADGEASYGVTSGLIMCFLRHLSEDDAFDTLKTAGPWLERLVGVGLDSSEVGHPPAKFEKVFARICDMGLKRVAHAGEEGPPEYVWQALDLLKIDRIDHGNRALEDPLLIDRLRTEQMTLTVCPLSNLSLCVVDQLEGHAIKAMLDNGLAATMNSDDPAYFGGYVNENFRRTAKAADLSATDLVTLARNSFSGAFLDSDRKATHLAAVDAAAAPFLTTEA